MNSLLTFVSTAFLEISSFLWEGVNFKLTTLKTGDASPQSNLDVEFVLKLWITLDEIHITGGPRGTGHSELYSQVYKAVNSWPFP